MPSWNQILKAVRDRAKQSICISLLRTRTYNSEPRIFSSCFQWMSVVSSHWHNGWLYHNAFVKRPRFLEKGNLPEAKNKVPTNLSFIKGQPFAKLSYPPKCHSQSSPLELLHFPIHMYKMHTSHTFLHLAHRIALALSYKEVAML